jgi:hypothetical protein
MAEPMITFRLRDEQLLKLLKLTAMTGSDLTSIAAGLRGVFATDEQVEELRGMQRDLTPDTLVISPRLVVMMTIGHANRLLADMAGPHVDNVAMLRPGAPWSLVMRTLRFCLALESWDLAMWSTLAFLAADTGVHGPGPSPASSITQLLDFTKQLHATTMIKLRVETELHEARQAYDDSVAAALQVALEHTPNASYAHLATLTPLDLRGPEVREHVIDMITDVEHVAPSCFTRFLAALRETTDLVKSTKRIQDGYERRLETVRDAVRHMDHRLVTFLMIAAFDHLPDAQLWPWVTYYDLRGQPQACVPDAHTLSSCPFEQRRDAEWRMQLDRAESRVLLDKLDADRARQVLEAEEQLSVVHELLAEEDAREKAERQRRQRQQRRRARAAKKAAARAEEDARRRADEERAAREAQRARDDDTQRRKAEAAAARRAKDAEYDAALARRAAELWRAAQEFAEVVGDNMGDLHNPADDECVDADDECVVCMERPRHVCSGPCGHVVMCGPCAAMWTSRHGHCPYCRAPTAPAVAVA